MEPISGSAILGEALKNAHWLTRIFSWLRSRIFKRELSKHLVRFVPSVQFSYLTPNEMTQSSDMQVGLKLIATNEDQRRIVLVEAALIIPSPNKIASALRLFNKRIKTNARLYNYATVAPQTIAPISVTFRGTLNGLWNQDSLRVRLVLRDNLGYSHTIKNIQVHFSNEKALHTPVTREYVASLATSVERDVATILKQELVSYHKCKPCAEIIGSFEQIGRSKLSSPNLDSLIKIHESCDEDGKLLFQKALSQRVEADEYVSVAYLSILALAETQSLEFALDVARSIPDINFSHSGISILLNELLTQNHAHWTDKELDSAEQFSFSASSQSINPLRDTVDRLRADRLLSQ